MVDCPSGVKVLRIDRPEGRRGLKFDSGFAAEGCGGRLTFIEGAHHTPCAGGASNLRTLGAIAPSNFRTLKPHRAPGRLYGFRGDVKNFVFLD